MIKTNEILTTGAVPLYLYYATFKLVYIPKTGHRKWGNLPTNHTA